VRNQTPTEREDGISAEEIRRREHQFFDSDPVLGGGRVPAHHLGVEALCIKLVQVQLESLKSDLPKLMRQVSVIGCHAEMKAPQPRPWQDNFGHAGIESFTVWLIATF
jgi:hypothetical protein